MNLEVISNCPVTNNTTGIINLAPGVVAELAGILEAEAGIEWAALGYGTVSPDTRQIHVTRLAFPSQYRNATAVEIDEHDITADLVCVFHSHHGMGAFFSGTDTSQLNPRYRASVVIANLGSTKKDFQTEREWQIHYNLLGFEYQAEMKVILPCGEIGRISAAVAVDSSDAEGKPPITPPEDWRDLKLQRASILGGCVRKKQYIPAPDSKIPAPPTGHIYMTGSCEQLKDSWWTVPIVARWGKSTKQIEQLREATRTPRIVHTPYDSVDRYNKPYSRSLAPSSYRRADPEPEPEDFNKASSLYWDIEIPLRDLIQTEDTTSLVRFLHKNAKDIADWLIAGGLETCDD